MSADEAGDPVVTVRAVRPLVVFDDDLTVHLVPKGATGTLVGAVNTRPALREEERRPVFLVDWHFHAIGDSRPDPCEFLGKDPSVVDPGFTVHAELDDIEFVSLVSPARPAAPAAAGTSPVATPPGEPG